MMLQLMGVFYQYTFLNVFFFSMLTTHPYSYFLFVIEKKIENKSSICCLKLQTKARCHLTTGSWFGLSIKGQMFVKS